MYGLMLMLGIVACFLVLFSYSKKLGLSNRTVDFVFYNGIASIIVGFIGAMLWQSFYNYIGDLKQYGTAEFKIDGSITAIGGLVTGAVCFIIISVIFRKQYPFALSQILPIAPCCMVIAHAFGRLGCFSAGCCYGKEATGFFSFLGVVFKPGSPAYSDCGANAIYPTQLFEAVFLFILFGILSYMCLKKKYYYNIVLYVVLYSIWRFLIEFLRADDRGAFVGSLSPSQTQSLVLLGAAVVLFFVFRNVKKKEIAYLSEQARMRAEHLAAQSNTLAPETAENSLPASAPETATDSASRKDDKSAINASDEPRRAEKNRNTDNGEE